MLILLCKVKEGENRIMEKQVIHIKVDQTKVRNEMHFEVQKKNRMQIFRNRKKYTRKQKHKGFCE